MVVYSLRHNWHLPAVHLLPAGCSPAPSGAAPQPGRGLPASSHSHDFFLSPADLRRGIAFQGTGARVRTVAGRLLAGQPLHVAVAGGSVAWGQGAPGGGHFGRRFFDWVNASWPAPTSSPHRFTNAAKPGITSALFALCGDDLIPQARPKGSLVPRTAQLWQLWFDASCVSDVAKCAR